MRQAGQRMVEWVYDAMHASPKGVWVRLENNVMVVSESIKQRRLTLLTAISNALQIGRDVTLLAQLLTQQLPGNDSADDSSACVLCGQGG